MIRTTAFNQLPVLTGFHDTTKFIVTNSGVDATLYFSTLLSAISGTVVSSGSSGSSGVNGNTILNGTGIPSNSSGVNGDFYLQTTTYNLYGPKTAGSWSSYVNLIGPTGATGPSGAQGPAGIQGPSGLTGPQGPSGLQGVSGATGATGAQGPSGLPGVDGRTILNGTGIPTSGIGSNGDFYYQTSTYDFYGPKTSGLWTSYINLIGPTGATGPQGPPGVAGTGTGSYSGVDGNTILSGSDVPDNASGVDGDYYFRSSTYDFYGPKTGGAWSSFFNMVGPTGATGPSGAQGLSGAVGATGPQGPTGATGPSGAQGASGLSGLAGKTILNGTGIPLIGLGVDGDFYYRVDTYDFYGPKTGGGWSSFINLIGPTGAQGLSGAVGQSGTVGAQGPIGPTGATGPSGLPGVDGKTVLNGTGVPNVGVGSDGDFYYRTSTFDFYGPKSGGSWSSFVNLIGPTGAQGASGAVGATGPQGPSGATGPQGPTGATGPQGVSGLSGIAGKTILNGTGIPSAGLGVDGDFYYRTSSYDFYGPKSGGIWTSFINIIGPTGATGPQGISGAVGATGPQGPSGATGVQGVSGLSGINGKTILNGTGIPSAGIGVDGDFYYRTNTYDFYGPKIAGAWSSFINIVGPTGAQGISGAIGATGPQGPSGATGVQGIQGVSGLSGINGKTILNGTGIPTAGVGVDGDFYYKTNTYDFYGPKSAGAWSTFVNIIGPTGVQGLSGAVGATGPQGPTGVQGISGLSGINGKTIHYGTGVPSVGIGVDGDFYFQQTTYDFYGPKTGGAWSSSFNMVGPSGATGPQGPSGVQGPSGAQGPSGVAPSGAMGSIYHGATSSTPRITGFSIVTWIGSVEPSNAIDNDVWINIA